MVCLSCTATGERVCLAAEGFGNRHCFLENIADKVFSWLLVIKADALTCQLIIRIATTLHSEATELLQTFSSDLLNFCYR